MAENLASINDIALAIISEAENKIKEQTGTEVVLIAYDGQN